MDPQSEATAAAVFDFLCLYDEDEAAGRVRSLGEYLRRFPRHEVAIAEEFFNAELLLNSETGELRVYLLDSHAENPVRVAQETIDLTVQLDSVTHELSLPAVADALTEETVGDSSQFAIQSSALVGVSAFQGSFGRIEGRGEVFESTAFAFPAAASHGHDGHDHDGHDHDGHDHDA